MRKFRLQRALLTLTLLALSSAPSWAQTPTPIAPGKPATVTVAQYRAQRVAARARLARLAARSGGGARDATNILKSLDKPQIVRRADGQTQRADGTRWSALVAGVAPVSVLHGSADDFDVKSLKRDEIQQLQRDLETEIAEVDAWNARPNGAYYAPVDAGAIIRDLEKSGQIRTGPTWLQMQSEAVKQWFLDRIEAFFKWIASLFPKSAPRAGGTLPDLSWLTFVMWAVIASLLGFLLWVVYRAFASNVRWRGRRKRANEAQLQNEDAELLLLPPDELTQRAARFAGEGNFREALRHRYIALLLRLDSRGVWRYDARRTNWEHIAALRRGAVAGAVAGQSEIVAPLSDLTRRFDRVRYGGATCDGAHWQQFERDAGNLEARAGAETRVAAEVAR